MFLILVTGPQDTEIPLTDITNVCMSLNSISFLILYYYWACHDVSKKFKAVRNKQFDKFDY